jgi:membrane-bound ClpP family serine protease
MTTHPKTTKQSAGDAEFAIGKENFKYIAIGVVILVIGFLLMSGGKSDDPNVFNPEIFSFRRITLAPIVVVGGFMFIIWAIMKKPKN